MLIVKRYAAYDRSRYGTPWVARTDKKGRPDFSQKVGGFSWQSGGYGNLYITDPEEGACYMYGRKDYRGGNTERERIKIVDGKAVPIVPREGVAAECCFVQTKWDGADEIVTYTPKPLKPVKVDPDASLVR